MHDNMMYHNILLTIIQLEKYKDYIKVHYYFHSEI